LAIGLVRLLQVRLAVVCMTAMTITLTMVYIFLCLCGGLLEFLAL
jgi:hypothetical protein